MDKKPMLLVQYSRVLIIGLAVAVLLEITLWQKNIIAVHTLIESICVVIGAAIFMLIWNTMNEIEGVNHIIGFGILTVIILDACHIYLFAVSNYHGIIVADMAIKLWILARLAEAIVLLMISSGIYVERPNKWIALAGAVIIPIAVIAAVIKFPGVFPFITAQTGFTGMKLIAECLVLAIVSISLMNFKKDFYQKNLITHRHLLIALLTIIPTQIMLMIPTTINSLNSVYGHILKILYYYCLYRSVFVSYVQYPYEKMKQDNIILEGYNAQLEQNKAEEIRRQAMLIQQEKLALLGQMGAGIVHETKNYLTTIKGSCQLAERLTNEERLLRHIKKINKSVDEIDKIVSRFLFMSKPRDTELKEISIYDLAQSMESLVMSTSFAKRADICFEISKEERYLLCDEGQINQVILNLCKNAIEAIEDIENARVFVETGYDEKTDEMYINVTDNGKGISPDDFHRIGTPFFTTKDNGTGLGLYVCYQIIKDHNGRIEVSSNLGKGTCFTVKLPCLKEDDAESKNANYLS